MQMVMAAGGMRPGGQTEGKLTADALNKIKDPVLKLLLANKSDQTELVEAGIKELIEAEQPTIDAFLLAASHAQSQSKPADALQLLELIRRISFKF